MKHIPRKRFGQNFLQDQNIINQILQVINPQPTDHIIEIGPGQGAITRPLCQHCQHIEVIEIDRDLANALMKTIKRSEDEENLKPTHPKNTSPLAGEVERSEGEGDKTSPLKAIHQQDVLTVNFQALKQNQPLRIVGNLPYNISTPLLFRLFKYIDHIQDIHVMLQKEVIDRLCAQPGNKTYGRLSVMAQFYCQIEPLIDVPPSAFYPAPKVDSGVVRLRPNPIEKRHNIDTGKLETLVKQAFSQRRKTLRNTLKPLLTEAELLAQGIDPKVRAETLSLGDFLRLSNIL